jgi:hypothetical protein
MTTTKELLWAVAGLRLWIGARRRAIRSGLHCSVYIPQFGCSREKIAQSCDRSTTLFCGGLWVSTLRFASFPPP